MHKPLRVEIGPTVKQYRRFHFKRLDRHRGDQEIESTHYYVVVENEDGSEESIGTIRIQESSLPELLNYLHPWLRRQYTSICIAKQQLGQIAEGDEIRTTIQLHIESLERRYNQVVQAIREIVPDYQPDEATPNLPSGLAEEQSRDLPDDLES